MRALVAMSGGVDSSLAALSAARLLGPSNVWGIHMLLNQEATCSTSARSCCSSKDAADAQQVAQKLGIYFDTVPMYDTFRAKVIDTFINEYKNGRTPVPCTLCNAYLKFELLFSYGESAGFDTIVTGHYARLINNRLYATDKKDQTYYLWPIKSQYLGRLLFPAGDCDNKESVRQQLRDNDIHTADKTESQNICFVKDDYRDFLEQNNEFFQPRKGNYVSLDGKVLGTHNGFWRHTIGQRASIAVGTPIYVVAINPNTNEVTVGPREASFRSTWKLTGENFHEDPEGRVLIKTNAHSKFIPATYSNSIISVQEPVLSVPGQATVLYRETSNGTILIGGGWNN